MANNWFVITGGPSSGKTTLLEELKKRGYQTVPEAARTVIDQAVARGISTTELRADEKRFQEEVTRLKEDVETKLQSDVITFFDRGMHDTLAYLRHYAYEVAPWIKALLQNSTYKKVFLLEPLLTYEQDYARTEDETFAKNIKQLLHDAYVEFGMDVVHVEAGNIEERADFILKHAGVEQDK